MKRFFRSSIEKRIRGYRKERPRRTDGDRETWDAALELVITCFEIAATVPERDRGPIDRLRWAARRFMRAARTCRSRRRTR
jgi:hypothetical protein